MVQEEVFARRSSDRHGRQLFRSASRARNHASGLSPTSTSSLRRAFSPADLHLDYGYGIYSARYGNIYTSRQWLQLIERAFGERDPLDRAWSCEGGFVDPFRPNIEPGAIGSADEVEVLRRDHLACVRQLFEQTDVFVFTLGMTETWMRVADGTVFPIAPGARGGVWDETQYRFPQPDLRRGRR